MTRAAAQRCLLRRFAAPFALALAALAIGPSGASADPVEGCGTDDAGVIREYTCYWKPPPIGPYEVKQDIQIGVPKPDVDGHITRMEVDVVDHNLQQVPISRLMLHHIVFVNANGTDKTCPNGYASFDERPAFGGYGAERFYAAGEERAKISFPDGYGYRHNAGNLWGMVYMFMNHRNAVDDDAWVRYKLTIDTSGTLEPVRPYWLDVRNCRADPIYNVPGLGMTRRERAIRRGVERKHVRSAEFTIEEDGWIVAGAGHVHGGARRLTITKPSCDNLRVAQSVPTWGLASHPFYRVRPVLHEPGPIGMSAFRTQRGIPVRAGQKIRLNSIYDGVRPHTRVMGIFIVYLAQDQRPNFDPGGPQACRGAPPGIEYGPGTNLPGRQGPIPYPIPLTGLDEDGNAITIKGPPGRFRRLRTGATIRVGDRFFSRPNVRLRQGARLSYLFAGSELHNLTLANGPLGIGSPNLDADRAFVRRFRRPGVYRFFCGLHPVQMQQRVLVEKKRKRHRRRR